MPSATQQTCPGTTAHCLTLRVDLHVISPYSISAESHNKVMKIKKMIKKFNEAVDYQTNSPCQ